jgi:hypothetical protein
MVKYTNTTLSWKRVVQEELDYYNNQEDDQDYDLGYEY